MVSVTIVQVEMFLPDLINLSEGLKIEGGQFFVPFCFLYVTFQGVVLRRWMEDVYC